MRVYIDMNQEMEKIVLGCQRRDASAQKRLYDVMAPRMMGLCMRYVHCREDAQDILHEGFITVFERIGDLDNPESLQAWMGRIMVNRAINLMTRNNQMVCCDLGQMQPADSEDEVLDTDRFCLTDVLEAMQQLPNLYRVAFNMHDVESMPYSEIANALHQTESSARGTVTRARQMLREILIKEIANED